MLYKSVEHLNHPVSNNVGEIKAPPSEGHCLVLSLGATQLLFHDFSINSRQVSLSCTHLFIDHMTHGDPDLHACPLDIVEVEVMEHH